MGSWMPIVLTLVLAPLGIYDLVAARKARRGPVAVWHVVRAAAAALLLVPIVLPGILAGVELKTALLLLLGGTLVGGVGLVVSTVVLYTMRAGAHATEGARRMGADS
jgi:hypothetical protein